MDSLASMFGLFHFSCLLHTVKSRCALEAQHVTTPPEKGPALLGFSGCFCMRSEWENEVLLYISGKIFGGFVGKLRGE